MSDELAYLTQTDEGRAVVERARAVLVEATPAPWGSDDYDNPHVVTAGTDADGCYVYPEADADIRAIAFMRNTYEALLSVAEAADILLDAHPDDENDALDQLDRALEGFCAAVWAQS